MPIVEESTSCQRAHCDAKEFKLELDSYDHENLTPERTVVEINIELWTLGGKGEIVGDRRDTLRNVQMERWGSEL